MSQPAVPLVQLDGNVAPLPAPTRNWARGHDVQFYETEAYLSTVVATFLVEGVRAGQPLVIIATEAHRRMFAERMRESGVRPEDLVAGRDIVWLDARDTLDAFMEGELPNAEMFHATVGPVFDRLAANGRWYVVARAYGEMVDLLWKDGRIEGAIALEQLWNDLAQRHSFALLCAYAMDNFVSDAHSADFARICAAHGHVSE